MVTRRQTLAGGLAVGVSVPLSAAIRPDRRGAFIDHVQRTMAASGVPGLAIALIEDGKISHVDGFGFRNVEDSARVDGDTLFRAGSISKPITALTMMRLAQAKKLQLDDPVARYLPQFRSDHTVSLRQLLNQTSGLADGSGEMLGRNPEALDYLRNPLAQGWAPGRFFSYSNPGYAIAGALIEAADRPSFTAQAARAMADIGMTRSTFELGTAITQPHTVGHDAVGGRLAVVRPEQLDVYYADQAAGALYTSARDLGHFAEWLITSASSGSPDARTFAEMTAAGARLDAIALGYGLGLGLDASRGSLAIGHGGSISGYRSSVYVLPQQGFGIAILANRAGRTLTDGLTDDAFHRLVDVPPSRAAPVGRTADLLGHYQMTRLDGTVRTVEVLAAGDTIAVRRPDGVVGVVEPSVRPDVFTAGEQRRVFVRDAKRQVVGMNLGLRHWLKRP